jgi:broad specificity phosphatase PhoE
MDRSGIHRARRPKSAVDAEVAPASSLKPLQGEPTMVWLIRHAEVEPKYQGVFGGRIDMDLSARGRNQAAALAAYLHDRPFDALYASPMKRVQQTLAPMRVNGIPRPVLLNELREVDFGSWTGLAWDEVEAKFGVSPFAWLQQLACAGIPGAECASALRERLEPCLWQILARHAGQCIAIACHGGVIRMLLTILLGWPLTQMAAVQIDYASLTQIVWSTSEARLQLLNFTPWRELSSSTPVSDVG